MKSIGQLAQSTGCHIETIRYYEKRGLLPKPLRSAGGHRLYELSHERRLSFIRQTRVLGFGLKGIAELIDMAKGDKHNCNEALEIAEQHLGTVNTKLTQLQRIKDSLERMICECRSGCACGEAPTCSILENMTE